MPMPITEDFRNGLADRYRIERELGPGGMANVYLARDLKHDRDVVLKVLKPELSEASDVARFLAEIRITASLQHPHILTLIDSGVSADMPYYVVPYIQGESLRDRLDRERQLSLTDAVAIVKPIAAALDYAHARNVVHRDVKPHNILLQDREAILADFGIALAVQRAGGKRLTESGYVLGTPEYMSPEQLLGDRDLDARSDVYSLGAVVYEMLAGEPPARGANWQALAARVLNAVPTPLHLVRSTVPIAVDETVARSLAKTPADRFQTAGEFAIALEAASTENPAALPRTVPLAPPPVLRVRRRGALVAMGTLAFFTAALWFAHRPTRANEPPGGKPYLHLTVDGSHGPVLLDPSDVEYTYSWTSEGTTNGVCEMVAPATSGIMASGSNKVVRGNPFFPAAGTSMQIAITCPSIDGTVLADAVTVTVAAVRGPTVLLTVHGSGGLSASNEGSVVLDSGDTYDYAWVARHAQSCKLISPQGAPMQAAGTVLRVGPGDPMYPKDVNNPLMLTIECTDGKWVDLQWVRILLAPPRH